MLKIYPLKMFTSYCISTKISVSLYKRDGSSAATFKIGGNVKDLSLENVHLKLF